MHHVKVPLDRVGVLIGEGGKTMRQIEEEVGIRLNIDSENGTVEVDIVDDPAVGIKGPDVVRAIGRGFPPAKAMRLVEDMSVIFDLVDIEAASRNQNDLTRKKGRLIGEGGRTRELMEELSGASVVIYGSTVGIIGKPQQVDAVRTAAEMLLDGAPHGAVYSFLEDRHREMKRDELSYHRYPGGT